MRVIIAFILKLNKEWKWNTITRPWLDSSCHQWDNCPQVHDLSTVLTEFDSGNKNCCNSHIALPWWTTSVHFSNSDFQPPHRSTTTTATATWKVLSSHRCIISNGSSPKCIQQQIPWHDLHWSNSYFSHYMNAKSYRRNNRGCILKNGDERTCSY